MFFILQIYCRSIPPEKLQFCFIYPHNNFKILCWLNLVTLSIVNTFPFVLLWNSSMHLRILVWSPVPCNVYPTVWMETSVLAAIISFCSFFASTWTFFSTCLHKNLVAAANIFPLFCSTRLSSFFSFHFELPHFAYNNFYWKIQHPWYNFVTLPKPVLDIWPLHKFFWLQFCLWDVANMPGVG